MLYTFIVDLTQYGVDWVETVLRALDLITIVVPPALPVVLSIGTYFSLRRLRLNNIYCTCPSRYDATACQVPAR
jgi:cation-transporting ATPase 13A3/4/5